ncbi:unnamed protein product [Phytomonas sp. EM1]|nr:unnamed protein product [Phytomonas sp. EM1]|eukprot:CCW65630.1 unnamed protein product [Phytomonas sp. isolate EM1]
MASYLGQSYGYGGPDMRTLPGLSMGALSVAVSNEVVGLPPTLGLIDPSLHVLFPVYSTCVAEPTAPSTADNTIPIALPPQLKKRFNGLKYISGGLYEGYVKRYNPVRGFGFLTATHQIFPVLGSAPMGSTATAKDFERSVTETQDLNGISAGSSPDVSCMPHELDLGAGGDGRPADTRSTPCLNVDTCMQLDPNQHSFFKGLSPDAPLTSFASDISTTSTAMKSMKSYTRVPTRPGDIFVHHSHVDMHGFHTMPVRGRVRFQVNFIEARSSYQAVNVELLPQVVPRNRDSVNTSTSDHLSNENGPSIFWLDEVKRWESS